MKFFRYRPVESLQQEIFVIRQDNDGKQWWLSHGESDPDYLAWVAEGNTAEEWQPDTTTEEPVVDESAVNDAK